MTVTAWMKGSSSAGSGNATSPNGESAPVRSVASSLTAWSSTSVVGQPGSMYFFFCCSSSATFTLWQADRRLARAGRCFTLVSDEQRLRSDEPSGEEPSMKSRGTG